MLCLLSSSVFWRQRWHAGLGSYNYLSVNLISGGFKWQRDTRPLFYRLPSILASTESLRLLCHFFNTYKVTECIVKLNYINLELSNMYTCVKTTDSRSKIFMNCVSTLLSTKWKTKLKSLSVSFLI